MGDIEFRSTWGFDLTNGGTRVGIRFERERTTPSGRKGKPEVFGTLYAEPGEGWPELLQSLANFIEQHDGDLEAVALEMAGLKRERAS